LINKQWLEAIDSNYACILPENGWQSLDSPHDKLKKQLNSLLGILHILTLKDLNTASSSVLKWTFFIPEREQPDTDKVTKVTVIDIKWEILQKLIPTKDELACLAHVRQGTDNIGNLVGDELAIIIGNRLPQKGKSSIFGGKAGSPR
jgi:hypothetical protein